MRRDRFLGAVLAADVPRDGLHRPAPRAAAVYGAPPAASPAASSAVASIVAAPCPRPLRPQPRRAPPAGGYGGTKGDYGDGAGSPAAAGPRRRRGPSG